MNGLVGRAWAGLHALALVCWCTSARAGDPYLEWYTIVTPHFRVNYHGGLQPLAERTAALAEQVYERLGQVLATRPSQVTEIVLTDDTDFANGSASAVPYDTVRMFASAPDDMSPLGEYDDWLNELVTHEFTHILHADNVSGLPALLNTILGKTSVPNQSQPRWILEGLAVTMESTQTSGGRLRSTQFDMFLRADLLEDNFARLDQFSNSARRWPGGTLWYLYGSKFIAWITDTYGPSVYAAVASDYGAQVVPWGINRSIRRVTGRTYEELYRGWKQSLLERYGAEVARIRTRGRREGVPITERGQFAGGARFTNTCGTLGKPSLVYARDDGDTPGGIYEVALDGSSAEGELRTRSGGKSVTLAPDCSLLLDDTSASRRNYRFTELFRLPPFVRGAGGFANERQRLTHGSRSREVDISADGRRIVYVTNDRGTSTLRIADIDANYEISGARALVKSARYEQAYTPRFSADGRRVAYSAWTQGGLRDVRVVDVASGRFLELFHDRALDQQPVFSPDGERLYFSSDRSGVANVYVYEFSTGALSQVTNVVNGAYFPEISGDGQTLVYTGYRSRGWDLFRMPLEPGRFLVPESRPDARGEAAERIASRRWPIERYRPLQSLRPRAYSFDYGPGRFGDTVTVKTSGRDAASLHGIASTVAVDVERAEPQVTLDYSYNRLPFAFRLSGFQSAVPRRDYQYGGMQPLVVERLTGISSGLSFNSAHDFEFEQFSLSYLVANFSSRLPLGPFADPYAPLSREPHRGLIGLLHLGYVYSSASSTGNAISSERGFTVGVGTDYADEVLGSESTLFAVNAFATGYLQLPWARHHVLALALSAGNAMGDYPRRGLYSLGGFVNRPLLDSYTDGVRQSAFQLRGYRPSQFIGTGYNLGNLEYRFPLWYADRGLSTLPIFLRTLSATLFADYGGAYDRLDLDDPLASYHLGLGAELWLDLVLGYYVGGNLRIGVAKGTDDSAPDGLQTYVVVSTAF